VGLKGGVQSKNQMRFADSACSYIVLLPGSVANNARQDSKNLVGDLTKLRYPTSSVSRPLMFVVHSLGGLVCENVRSGPSFPQNHQYLYPPAPPPFKLEE
jgi:hypothetical protein